MCKFFNFRRFEWLPNRTLKRKLRAKSNALKHTDKKYKALQDELLKAQNALEEALQVMEYKPTIYKMKPSPVTKTGEATHSLRRHSMDKKCTQCGRVFQMSTYWEVLGQFFCGKRCWEKYNEKTSHN